MKNVLVIYFTQTGQLQRAAKATLKNLESDPEVTLHYKEIKPKTTFPYPWTYIQFFDAFPETVHSIPCEIEPLEVDAMIDYDLIIIAYQPWFLSVSRPVDSFLQTEQAKTILKNKPVVTILACRNMWLNAQEKMKRHLINAGAHLVGNITFVDRNSNLVSLVTVLAFELGGIQDKYLGVFPKYGVSDEELNTKAWKFGDIISTHLKKADYSGLQKKLIDQGAINIKSNLMIMEGRGKVLFPIYANFILKKGKANSKERRTRVRIFGIVLPLLILILSPLITIVSRLAPLIFPAKTRKEIDYYSGTQLKP
ncbi:MAG TPA: dialkylresorcinol condensing enzyme DarA [Bacteroidia bacterium]|nr:dialkylresorcinol condensing enzyme DarA [Bacteroidia bacterium]